MHGFNLPITDLPASTLQQVRLCTSHMNFGSHHNMEAWVAPSSWHLADFERTLVELERVNVLVTVLIDCRHVVQRVGDLGMVRTELLLQKKRRRGWAKEAGSALASTET